MSIKRGFYTVTVLEAYLAFNETLHLINLLWNSQKIVQHTNEKKLSAYETTKENIGLYKRKNTEYSESSSLIMKRIYL
jgi:hypothetical protein